MIKKLIRKILNKQDPKFRVPRIFSNNELKKFAHFFEGKIINVSGWTDEDKQGGYYKDYFSKKSEYWISNFKSNQKGMVGQENEIFVDLEQELENKYIGKFDVAFNHTTLEHIYDFHKAFSNICKFSNDVVIIVVPYIQQIHGIGYSDYWRFTPHSVKKMYEYNGLTLRYCSANGSDNASIYLVCIGYRNLKWNKKIPKRFDLKINNSKELYADDYSNIIGGNVV